MILFSILKLEVEIGNCCLNSIHGKRLAFDFFFDYFEYGNICFFGNNISAGVGLKRLLLVIDTCKVCVLGNFLGGLRIRLRR